MAATRNRFRRPSAFPSTGFTLVELLVVISIIGLLIALLLPAVQAARESARQTQCKNSLKQVGLALQVHMDTCKGGLPIGCARSPQTGLGMSWWVELLPYCEQSAIFEALDREGKNCGFPQVHPTNASAAGGGSVMPFLCPSSPLPKTVMLGNFSHMQPSYVGIAGATNGDGVTSSQTSACCSPVSNGEISSSGVLIPNRRISIADVLDGAAHTMCVSETSDFAYSAGTPVNLSAAVPNSWISGTAATGTPPQYHASANPPPCWNVTTIRYAPNMSDATRPGIRVNHGPNNPLSSAHPGGVFCLMLDGSAHFLRESVSMATLRKLALRKDGMPASLL